MMDRSRATEVCRRLKGNRIAIWDIRDALVLLLEDRLTEHAEHQSDPVDDRVSVVSIRVEGCECQAIEATKERTEATLGAFLGRPCP